MKLRSIIAATAVLCLAFGITGCGSDSDSSSSSTTTTPKEAVCADRSSLKKSVQSLTDSDTLSGGKSSIESALKKVQKNLDSLKSSTKSDLQPEVDAVKKSLDQLQTVVSGFGSGSITSNLTKAGNAISKVGTSTSDLVSALSTDCP